MIWVTLALFAASFLASQLLAPKPQVEDARAASLDDFNFPRADEGDPVPWIIGRVRLDAPNTLWYGDYIAEPVEERIRRNIFSSTTVVVGYRYRIGINLGLCLGPDVRIRQIWIDDKLVFSGGAATDVVPVSINHPDLFGGDDRGGGFQGPATFYAGQFDQIRDTYMTELEGENYPPYTGQAHIIFKNVYIGTSPQLRKMSFELERVPNPLGLDTLVNRIGNDINPMTALYDLMTSLGGWGGLQIAADDIDTAAFISVATILANEEHGISMKIARPNSAQSAIQEILRQIDGVLYQDPATGKITIALIRDDYDEGTLPVFNETNIVEVRNFTRTAWSETFNQVRVTFTSRDKDYATSTSVAQDMANINSQGRLRTTELSFPGCSNGPLATRLAARELSQQSVPLFSVTLRMNRQGYQLRPGSPFVWSWSDYGIQSVVMRVQKFNLGELTNGRIVVEALQDSFGVSTAVFADPADTLWNPISRAAVNATQRILTEAPYWIVQQVEELEPEDNLAWPMVAVRNPSALLGFRLYTSADDFATDTVNDITRTPFTGSAILNEDISLTDNIVSMVIPSITIREPSPGPGIFQSTTIGETAVYGTNLFQINGELMACASITDNGDGTYTLNNVYRALLDTTLENHATDDILYALTSNSISRNDRGGADLVYFRTPTFSDIDAQELADVSSESVQFQSRYNKPAPPDYTLIEGFRAPGVVASNTVAATWTARTRLAENITLPTAGAETPEDDTTYTATMFINGYQVAQNGGLVSPTTSFTGLPSRSGTGRVEVIAVRPGPTSSWQPDVIEFPYVNPPSMGSNLLTNGDFEAGDLSSWTVTAGDWTAAATGTPSPIGSFMARSLKAAVEATQAVTIAVPDRSRMALVTALQAAQTSGAAGGLEVWQDASKITTVPSLASPDGEWRLRTVVLPLDSAESDVNVKLVADNVGVLFDEVTVRVNANTKDISHSYNLQTGVTAVVGAWALRRVVSTYSGPLIRVRDTRTGTETDIGMSGVDLDTFVKEGELEVIRWYDQSGNGVNLEPGSAANRPILTPFDTDTGRPAITFNQGATLIDPTPGQTRAYMVTRPNVMACVGPRLQTTLNASLFSIPEDLADPSNRRWGLGTAGATVFTTFANNSGDNFTGDTASGNHVVFIDYTNGSTYYDDGATAVDTFTAQDITYPFETRLIIGNNPLDTLAWEGGTLNELVIFQGDLDSTARGNTITDLKSYWFNT